MTADRLREYGFWDYTAPGAGGMEHYGADDYVRLMDDMADARMNSLVIVVKWLTTGYRSDLPWLDQEPGNAVIASDNELIRTAVAHAHRRGLKVWLGVVVTESAVASYGPTSYKRFLPHVDGRPVETSAYDLDLPGVAERSEAMCEEIVTLFPEVDGLMVEMEGADLYGPHRVAPYNRWAEAHGKDLAEADGTCPAFQTYTTFRRCEVLREIARAVQALGFKGDLATICDTINEEYQTYQQVDLREFAKRTPDHAVVTYSHSRWRRRLAMSDYCMVQPREYGLRTYYLGRGVMTYNKKWHSPQPKLPLSLPEHWAIDVEDVSRYRPDGFWWLGTGALREGAHVDLSELRRMGFQSGEDARRQLIEAGRALAP